MLRRVLLLIGSSLFVIAGVLMAVLGKGSDRTIGVITAIFFGAGIVVSVLPLFQKGGAGGMEIGEFELRGKRFPALIFPPSRAKIGALMLGSFCMAAGGVGMAVFAPEFGDGLFDMGPSGTRVVGIVGAAFFAFGAFFIPAGARKRLLAYTPVGVAILGKQPLVVPWEWIGEIAVFHFSVSLAAKQAYLGVRLHPGSESGLDEATAKMIRTGRKTFGWDFAVPTQNLLAPPRVLEILGQYYLYQPEARQQLGTQSELERMGKMLSGG